MHVVCMYFAAFKRHRTYSDRLKLMALACTQANVGAKTVAPLLKHLLTCVGDGSGPLPPMPHASTIGSWTPLLGVLAQIQAFEAITSAPPNTPKILAKDGTTKNGHKYISFR